MDLGESAGEEDLPELLGGSAGFSEAIPALDRRISDLDRRFGPSDQAVIDARDKHAELTGQSGDVRGAAALYNRLGLDCQAFFGPYDVKALNAFEGVARWIARAGNR